jgi:hypothetical protein
MVLVKFGLLSMYTKICVLPLLNVRTLKNVFFEMLLFKTQNRKQKMENRNFETIHYYVYLKKNISYAHLIRISIKNKLICFNMTSMQYTVQKKY